MKKISLVVAVDQSHGCGEIVYPLKTYEDNATAVEEVERLNRQQAERFEEDLMADYQDLMAIDLPKDFNALPNEASLEAFLMTRGNKIMDKYGYLTVAHRLNYFYDLFKSDDGVRKVVQRMMLEYYYSVRPIDFESATEV